MGFAGVQPEDLRTVVVNAAYRISSADKVVAQTGTMTASRVFLLPRATSMQPGQEILVVDESGTVTGSNTIVITRQASDTIGAGTTSSITAAYGSRRLVCDGLSKWTVVNPADPLDAEFVISGRMFGR